MSIIKTALTAAAFAGLNSAASADPADERSLNYLIAELERAGLSQGYLTNQPNAQNPSFVTLAGDADCKIVVEQIGESTYFRPSQDCSCDETIGTPHRSSIENDAFTEIIPSDWLVARFRAVGIIDGQTREVVFIPKDSCESDNTGTNTQNGNTGGCNGNGCGGGTRPDRDPPTGGGGNTPPGP